MFSAAIFDMDGLLVDSERAIMDTWITAGLELGIELSASDYLQIVGRSSGECELILTSLLGGPATFREALTRVRLHLNKPSEHPIFPLKSGARTLLTELSRLGIPCAVASSSPVDEIRSRLGRVNVLQCFKTLAGGDEVDRGKPDPAVYRLAAQRLGMPPDGCLAFEDSDNGACAAAGAGIAVVVVPDLKSPADDVAVMSFRVLENLDMAIEHVSDWFTTSNAEVARTSAVEKVD